MHHFAAGYVTAFLLPFALPQNPELKANVLKNRKRLQPRAWLSTLFEVVIPLDRVHPCFPMNGHGITELYGKALRQRPHRHIRPRALH